MPDLKRDTVKAWLADPTLPDGPRKLLQARLDASRASTAKLAAIAAARSLDGRVRGTFQYYGAGRTGRWAGRRFQPQNLFRGSIKDVPAAIRAIRAGAPPDDLAMLFEDSALGVVASCMRSTIMAAPLHRLVVADLAQIEARVLAWLAGQGDALRVFAAGEDIYTATANAIGSTNRQLGKVLVLACGFGMGPERFRQTALGYDVVLDEKEAADAVFLWRQLNGKIVTLWWDAHRTLMRVLRYGPGSVEQLGFLTFIHRPRRLLIKLPSGRHLVYREPRIEQNGKGFDEFTYMGSLGGNWIRLRAWPGKTCLAAGTLVLTDQGWLPIQSVCRAMRIWDGGAWVRHEGVVLNGVADCVILDGVRMTPDHEVLTDRGWRHAEFSAGLNRYPVELPDCVEAPRGRHATWEAEPQAGGDLAGPVRLRPDQADAPIGFHQRPCQDLRVPKVRADQSKQQHSRDVEAPSILGLAFDERQMPAAQPPGVEELWRSWDHSLPGVASLLRCVLARHGADLPVWSEHRSCGQRQWVFAGELHLEDSQGSGREPSSQAVYDIVNAGPRRRFVVAGRAGPLIVHNCENIVQAVARDVMVEAMLVLAGQPLIATIHDELIAEVPETDAEPTLALMLKVMRRTPAWAPGLPINAAGFVVRRYQKS
jgi:hypothetical protein